MNISISNLILLNIGIFVAGAFAGIWAAKKILLYIAISHVKTAIEQTSAVHFNESQTIIANAKIAFSECKTEVIQEHVRAVEFLREMISPESIKAGLYRSETSATGDTAEILEKAASAREFARDAVKKAIQKPRKLRGDFLSAKYHVNEKPFGEWFSDVRPPLAVISTDGATFEIRIGTFDNQNTTTINGERTLWSNGFILQKRDAMATIIGAYFPTTLDVRRFEEMPTEFLLDLHCFFCDDVLNRQGSLRYVWETEDGRGTAKSVVAENAERLAGATTAFNKTESLVDDMDDAAQDLRDAGAKVEPLTQLEGMPPEPAFGDEKVKPSDASDTSAESLIDELCESEFASVYHFDAGDSPSVIEFKDCVKLGTLGFGTEILVVFKASYSTRSQATIDERDGATVVLVRDFDTNLIETVFVPNGEPSLRAVAAYFRLNKNIEPVITDTKQETEQ
jgi:hypothetical protein